MGALRICRTAAAALAVACAAGPLAAQEFCDTCDLPWGTDCSIEPRQCSTLFGKVFAPYTDFQNVYFEMDFMPLRRDVGGSVVYAMRRLDTFGDSRPIVDAGPDGVFRTPDDIGDLGGDGLVGGGDDTLTSDFAPVVQRGFGTGTAVLSTDHLPSDWESGMRFAAGFRLTEELRIEGSYFGLHEWDGMASFEDNGFNNFDDGSTDSITNADGVVLSNYSFDDGFFGPGTGSLFSPFTDYGSPLDQTFAFDLNDFVEINFVSNLHSADLNFYYQVPVAMPRMNVTFLGGARYINVSEQFRYHGRSNSVDLDLNGILDAAVIAAPIDNRVATEADNQLFGPQIGALMQYQYADRGWLDFESKVAIMNNSSSQRTVFTTTVPGLVGGNLSAGDDGVAFAGDMALVAKFQPFNGLMFNIGYHATFIDGLALAQENAVASPEVLQAGPPPDGNRVAIKNNGDVIYHGPRIGARVTF